MIINKNYRDNFAYDLHKNVQRYGEVKDTDAISQSIEMILTTIPGERIFNESFGSRVPLYTFELMNERTGEDLLNDAIAAIKKWEDRVEILEAQCKLVIQPNDNAVQISIPYVIKKNNIVSVFQKKIIF